MAARLKRRAAAAGLLLLVPAAAAQDDAADKAVFQQVCGACHAVTMIADLKTQSEWIETIDNMTAVGAKGTEAQFAGVMRFLARNFTKVNVNTAAAQEIAPVLAVTGSSAQAVIAYRTRNGNFTSLEDLKKVPGLSASQVDARKDRIAFR